jgi:hypothetical protein
MFALAELPDIVEACEQVTRTTQKAYTQRGNSMNIFSILQLQFGRFQINFFLLS